MRYTGLFATCSGSGYGCTRWRTLRTSSNTRQLAEIALAALQELPTSGCPTKQNTVSHQTAIALARRAWTNERFLWSSLLAVFYLAPAYRNVTNAMRRRPSVWYLPTTMPMFSFYGTCGPILLAICVFGIGTCQIPPCCLPSCTL